VQVIKAAEHIEASDAEDRRRDAESHQRPAIGKSLPRNGQLFIRHRFALPQLAQNRWDASDLVTDRQCWSAYQPHHEHGGNRGEEYYGREGGDRQMSPQAQIHCFTAKSDGCRSGRVRTSVGHQNHGPRIRRMQGTMNERTISVSRSRPMHTVVPT
jgi:hypothetical protein